MLLHASRMLKYSLKRLRMWIFLWWLILVRLGFSKLSNVYNQMMEDVGDITIFHLQEQVNNMPQYGDFERKQ